MRRLALILVGSLLAGATHADASEAGRFDAAAAVETHATSNALDAPRALSDSYQILRGSLSWSLDYHGGTTKLAAEAQASAYRRYAIEDDRAIALVAEHRRRIGRFELRGALSTKASSEGDDIQTDGGIVGIRTATASLGAEAEIGIDLGGGIALVAGGSLGIENPGRTRFGSDILPPLRLEADASRLRGSIALRRATGRFLIGVASAFGRTDYEMLGDPPVSVSSRTASAQVELRFSPMDGAALAASVGIAALRADDGLFAGVRPVWELAAVVPLGGGATLKGLARAGFDTVETDDPLASFVRRAEIEIAVPLRAELTASAGLFGEIKDNLLLENAEHVNGAYAELGYAPSGRLSLVLRADYRDERATVFDTRTRTLYGLLRLAWKLG